MIRELVAAGLLAAAFSGCAKNQAIVDYRSEPPYARLYEGDSYLGEAPVRLMYDVDGLGGNDGRLSEVTAFWDDGSSRTLKPRLLPGPDSGYVGYYEFLIRRGTARANTNTMTNNNNNNNNNQVIIIQRD